MKKHRCTAKSQAAETLVCEVVLVPRTEDRRRPLMMSTFLQIDVDQSAAAAWPMEAAPLDQKVTINRMLQAWRMLLGGRILIEEAVSLGFVGEEVEVAVMEAPVLLNVLVSMKAQLVSSPPA